MSLFTELKRRSVFKVGAAYLIVAWLVIQAASIGFPAFAVPGWVLRAFILVLLLGFPVALVLAWAFEITPEGVKVDPGGAGSKRVLIGAAVLALLAVAWFYRGQPSYMETDPQAHAGPPSIAVLPFANLSGDASQDYFSDGMTEELLNVLAQIPGLEVAARTSVFQYKDKGGDVREIGRKLGVEYLIEGSVRRDQQELRITAQMIRVADGFHMWSETWDRKLEGVFALQEDIAKRIAEQLEGSLAPTALPASRGSIDPVAYDEYLKARELFRARRQLPDAIAHLERAVAKAPDFAAAWATLSLAYEVAPWYTTRLQRDLLGDVLIKMKVAATHAAALAPTAATTLHALGNVARDEGRYADAEQLYEKGIAADLTYPDVREDYSEFLISVGRTEDSLAAARAGIGVDPMLPMLWFRVADAKVVAGDKAGYDEAASRIREIAPELFGALFVLSDYALERGDIGAARQRLDAAYAQEASQIGETLALFRWSQGAASIDDATARNVIAGDISLSQFAALKGDKDLFFASIAAPRDPNLYYTTYEWLAYPNTARMLTDPRAKALLRDRGFEAYWRAKGWPALCHPVGADDFECGPAKGNQR